MGAQNSTANQEPAIDPTEDSDVEDSQTVEEVPDSQEPLPQSGYRAAVRELFRDLRDENITSISTKYGRKFLQSQGVQRILQHPRWKEAVPDESVEAAQLVFDVLVRLGGPLVGIHPWELLNSVRALALLQQELRTEPGPIDIELDGETPPEGDFDKSRTYMPFAVAAYGHALPALLGIVPLQESDWTEEAAIAHLTGIDTKVDLVTASFGSGLYNPGHFVAVNRSTKEVIVSVRGTYKIEDLITDVVMEESPFQCRLPRISRDQPGFAQQFATVVMDALNSGTETKDIPTSKSWASKETSTTNVFGLGLNVATSTNAGANSNIPDGTSRSREDSNFGAAIVNWPATIGTMVVNAFGCIENTVNSVWNGNETDVTRSSSLISFNARFGETDGDIDIPNSDDVTSIEQIVSRFEILKADTQPIATQTGSESEQHVSRTESLTGSFRSVIVNNIQSRSIHAEMVQLNGKTHGGWLKAAQVLDSRISDTVRMTLADNPGYRLVLTGHSMGATIASLLTLMWAEREEFSSARCYAFATPGTLTLPMARHPLVRERIFSVSLGNDFVSRFGHPNLSDLRGALLRLARPCPWDHRRRSFAQVVLQRGGLPKKQLKAIMELLEREEMNHEKLFPAGTLWYATVYGINESTTAQRVKPEFFGELLLTADMFTTHFGSLITLSRYGGVDIHRYVNYLGI